jgi:hypothetical protein
MAALAVRLGEWWKLDVRRDNQLKVVAAAVPKIGERRMLEVAPQKLGIRKLAMRRNEFRPERRLAWAIAHASNELELSRGERERAWLRVEGFYSCESEVVRRLAVGWSDWLDRRAIAQRRSPCTDNPRHAPNKSEYQDVNGCVRHDRCRHDEI